MKKKFLITILIMIFFFNTKSFAYIGPGMSGGALVAVLGFLVAIFAGIFGLIYFPVKRFILKLRANKKKNNENILDKK